MARNRDIKIWKDPFYRALPPLYKCLWDYINDDCDNAGIWHVDFKVASICIGRKVSHEQALKYFGDRILVSPDNHRWYITTFIQEKLNFDPARLNPTNKFQKSIIDLLQKHQIENFKGYTSPYQGAIYKDIVNAEAEASERGIQGGEAPNSKLKTGKSLPPPTDNRQLTTNHAVVEVGTPSPHGRLIVKGKYVHDPTHIVHDLRQYFEHTGQLPDLILAGWTNFDGFMKLNPGARFNDEDHLYNAFRQHSTKAKEKPPNGASRDWSAAGEKVKQLIEQTDN